MRRTSSGLWCDARTHDMSDTNQTDKPVGNDKPAKTPARPGSQWATGKRKNQKGFTAPKGFARGAKIK
jgi:hypothetical protein